MQHTPIRRSTRKFIDGVFKSTVDIDPDDVDHVFGFDGFRQVVHDVYANITATDAREWLEKVSPALGALANHYDSQNFAKVIKALLSRTGLEKHIARARTFVSRQTAP